MGQSLTSLVNPTFALLAVWGGYALGRAWQLLLLTLVASLCLLLRSHVCPSGAWLAAWTLPFLLAFPTAFDHQWATQIGLVAGVGFLVFSCRSLHPGGERQLVALIVAASSVVAIAQALGGQGSPLPGMGLLPEGLEPTALARLATGRAFGTLPLPGHFAALQALVVPVLALWLLSAKGWQRLVPGLLLLLSLAGTLATRSLVGTTLWGGALLLSVASSRRLPRRFWLMAPLLILALPLLLRRADLLHLEPVALRWVNWRVAWWSFRESPWFGVGPGGMGVASLTSPWAAQNITPFAHNTPLQLLAELGVLGLPFLVIGLFSLGKLLVRLWNVDRPGSLAVGVGLAHNLVDFSFYEPGFLYPFLLLLGSPSSASSPPGGRRSARWMSLALALPVFLVAALETRCESLVRQARQARTPGQKAAGLLAAAAGTPWRLGEVVEAVGPALASGDEGIRQQVLEELTRRSWVAPRSASLAQAKALLCLTLRRRGEAWVWAREAHRRAPHRAELRALEEQCRP